MNGPTSPPMSPLSRVVPRPGRSWYAGAALACALLTFVGIAISQEQRDKPRAQPARDSRPATADAWRKATEPDENHKRLDALVGRWRQVVRTPAGDGTWTETRGTTEYRWILGDRFLVEEARCDFDGTPFEWFGLYGYDKERRTYTAVWADNAGTQMDTADGAVDADGRVFTFSGEQSDPHGGGKTRFKWVIRIEGREKSKVEMFEIGADGKETKVMEILQSR
jgi:hypothetical protein